MRRLVQQPADGAAALRGQEAPQERSPGATPGAAGGQPRRHGEHRSAFQMRITGRNGGKKRKKHCHFCINMFYKGLSFTHSPTYLNPNGGSCHARPRPPHWKQFRVNGFVQGHEKGLGKTWILLGYWTNRFTFNKTFNTRPLNPSHNGSP